MGKSQGVVITLIIFIVLTLALGVVSYFMAQGYKETFVKLTEAQKQLQTAEGNIRTLTGDVDKMKEKIGYPTEMETASLLEELETVLKNASGDQTETPKTCRAVIEGLFQNITRKNEELQAAVNERDSYKLMADNEEEKTRTQKEEFDKTIAQLTEENQRRSNDANQRYDELNSKNLALVKELETVKKEASVINRQYQDESADAKETVDLVAGINESLRTKIDELTDPVFEIPDGKIVYVDQLNKVVRLNIGKADGVRLLTTFGVFPQDSLEKGDIRPKGSLEIIRIVSDHESEARILTDEMENPFTPGDMIYTPLWKTGQEVKVALDYFLDVDRDNKDDLDLMINMINAAGSKVSAWIDDKGEIRGSVTPDVTYLVTSDDSIFKILEEDHDLKDDMKAKIQKAHMKMINDARTNGVREIKLSEFLRRTHFKQSAEVSRFQEPGGLANKPNRTGDSVVSHANIAPIYDPATKDAKPRSFGVTAPIYDSKRDEAVVPSTGKVSDSYFRRRTPKDL